MTAYEKIFLMNTLIGNEVVEKGSPEFWTQMRNQVALVVEESEEAFEEAIDEDINKLLKEVSDIMVTALGLYQKLQNCGYPIEEALDKVCDNNLTKFHRNVDEANLSVKHHHEQGLTTFVRMIQMDNGNEYFGIIRKSDGKLLKPYDYVKINTQDWLEDANEPTE
jgi:phosphoribosyl-ATP pyrophosphohydrolase